MLDVSAGEIIVYVNNDTSQQVIGLWMEGEDYIRILSGEDEPQRVDRTRRYLLQSRTARGTVLPQLSDNTGRHRAADCHQRSTDAETESVAAFYAHHVISTDLVSECIPNRSDRAHT